MLQFNKMSKEILKMVQKAYKHDFHYIDENDIHYNDLKLTVGINPINTPYCQNNDDCINNEEFLFIVNQASYIIVALKLFEEGLIDLESCDLYDYMSRFVAVNQQMHFKKVAYKSKDNPIKLITQIESYKVDSKNRIWMEISCSTSLGEMQSLSTSCLLPYDIHRGEKEAS